MKINTTCALLGNFDAKFPDSREIGPDDDRIPGRDLANLVYEGLSARSFKVEKPTNEEPFFEIKCLQGDYEYEILCFIYYPSEINPVWCVKCDRVLGFIAKLFGKSEDKELAEVVGAIDEILQESNKVHGMRWFTEWPTLNPFGDGGEIGSMRALEPF